MFRDAEEPFEGNLADGVLPNSSGNNSNNSAGSSLFPSFSPRASTPTDAFGFPTIDEDTEVNEAKANHPPKSAPSSVSTPQLNTPTSTPPPYRNTSSSNNGTGNGNSSGGPTHSSSPVPRPEMARRLTDVSKRYDLQGKGYLDETERALRRLDSNNQGYLDMEKVYGIMEHLQKEQVASSELLDALRQEHRRSITLRRGVIGLICFTVLLAVSNIGTSFAAARLAKDTRVSESGDLTSTTGTRVGVTAKQSEFAVQTTAEGARDNSRRERHLQELTDLVCGDVTANADGTSSTACELQGTVTFESSVQLYQQFCSSWPNAENTCQGPGVSQLYFNCNGVRSTIFDILPPTGPSIDVFGFEYMIFPSESASYQARQTVYASSDSSTSSSPFRWHPPPCQLDFEMSLYCPTSGSQCALFATYDIDQCPGLGPSLCGTSNAI